MSPDLAVDIITRDKTASGFASAEKRAKGFAKKSAADVDKSGISKLGKQFEGLAKFRNVDFGFNKLGGSLQFVGRSSSEMASGFGGAVTKVLSFGAAADSALGGVAALAGGAAGAVAGLGAVLVAGGVGVYMLGDKWAKTGAEIDRTSKTVGIAARDLQGLRAAGEQAGIGADATTAGIDGLSSAIYDMRSGQNNMGLAVLDRLGVKLKYTKDGAADTTAMLYDLADAIARQKDPQVQRAIARQFGVEGMLPLLRQGSMAMKFASADFTHSATALSDPELAKSVVVQRQAARLRQRLGGVEARAGVAAMGATGAMAQTGIGAADSLTHRISNFPKDAASTIGAIVDSGKSLAHDGLEAGRHLVDGADRAAAKMIAHFEGFIDHAKWDRNAYRTGYGSDTVTDASGRVSRVTPGTRVSRDAALLDLSRRVKSEFMPKVARSVGAEWGSFDDQTKAALTSVAYNYGHLPRNVLAAARSGDPDAIAAAIRVHESDNGGINARRRDAEADVVAGAPARAHVEIVLKGAGPGTVAHVTGAPGVDVGLKVARGMDGP